MATEVLSEKRLDFTLACVTPQVWIEHACQRMDTILVDHAWCEKRAAIFALKLMQCYPQYEGILEPCSRIVREEMRHFELVHAILQARNIAYRAISSCAYARTLYQTIRSSEPERFLDLCLVGALIEARSAERFHVLADALDDLELKRFYQKLYHAEKRHFLGYVEMAHLHLSDEAVQSRWVALAAIEEKAILTPSEILRFHSGVPQS